MKYFYQLNKILSRKQKITYIFLTFLTFISMMLEILTLNFMFILLNYLTNPLSLENSKVLFYLENLNLNYELDLIFIVIFVATFTTKTFFNIFISWKEQSFFNYTRAKMSFDYFKGYLYLPRIFHLRSNTSNLIKNITVEVDNIMIALNALSTLIMEMIILLGVSIFLLFVDLKLTVVSFLLLTIFSIILSLLNTKSIINIGKDRIKVIQLRLKSIIEGLSGSKIFELTGSRENQLTDFSKHNDKFAKITLIFRFRNSLPKPLFELFVFLIIGLILIFSFEDKSKIVSIIPTLGVFLAAAYRLIPSFAKITESVQKFQFNIQTAEKLTRDKEKFENIRSESKENAKRLVFKNSINFKNVGFSYDKNLKLESNFVLNEANCELTKGSKIGIVGTSGSGKSTFLDIFMGLILPQRGEILIDGKKIQDIKSSWQKIIGCVPQEVFILDDTLKRNVAFGLPDTDIDEEKVNQAIELANLSEFKNNLEFGLETLLGEGGSRLSGGQRQRIGIARALYNGPDILIFDEATNALDEITERKIIKEIFEKKEDKTIIFVSHNMKNLSFCSTIYEIKNRTFSKLK